MKYYDTLLVGIKFSLLIHAINNLDIVNMQLCCPFQKKLYLIYKIG